MITHYLIIIWKSLIILNESSHVSPSYKGNTVKVLSLLNSKNTSSCVSPVAAAWLIGMANSRKNSSLKGYFGFFEVRLSEVLSQCITHSRWR